jgi:hypothetical protein
VPDFVGNCAGVSFSTGTEDYLTEAGTGRHQRIDEVLTEGQEVSYYAASSLTAVTGYETGIAIWRDSTNILEVQSITTSSNGGGKVYWPAGGVVIYVTASVDMIFEGVNNSGASGPLFGMPRDEGVLIFNTGQSNAPGFPPLLQTTVAANPNIFVWSSTTNAFNGPRGWVVADPTRAYSTGYNGTDIYVGYYHGNTCPVWLGLAQRVQEATGKKVYAFSVAKPGVSITEWSGVVGSEGPVYASIASEWAAASAALALIPGAPTFAAASIWIQGSNDAADAMIASDWAVKQIEFRRQCDIVIGITDRFKTSEFLLDLPPLFEWDGVRIANAQKGNASTLISIASDDYIDDVHLNGESHREIGRNRVGAAFLSGPQAKTQGLEFRTKRQKTYVNYTWVKTANSITPPIAGSYNYDAANGVARFHALDHTLASLTGKLVSLNVGSKYIIEQASDSTKSILFTVAGPVEYDTVNFVFSFAVLGTPTLGASGAPDDSALSAGRCALFPVIDSDPVADSTYFATGERIAFSRIADNTDLSWMNIGTNQSGLAQKVSGSSYLGELVSGSVIHTRHVVTTPNASGVVAVNMAIPDATEWGYIAQFSAFSASESSAGGAMVRGVVCKKTGENVYGGNGAMLGKTGTQADPIVSATGSNLVTIVGGIAAASMKHTVDFYMWRLL